MISQDAQGVDWSAQKKYRKGFTRLRKHHEAQFKKLQDIQREDLDAIAEKTPPPPPPPPPPVPVEVAEAERKPSPAVNTKEQTPRPNVKEKQKQLERGRAVNEHQREALSTTQQTTQQLQKTMHRHHDRSKHHTDKNMSWSQPPQSKSHTDKIIPGSKPPTVATAGPPTVATAGPPTVATAGPPTVATAGPPSVATAAGPPVVASSGSRSGNNNNSNYRGKSQKKRRDSNQPLFDTRPITFKPSTLLGDTTGSIYIKNKPDRVIINGQDFGSPKDFDDAINGIQRHDNSIFKRHLAGDTYLYFKPSVGKFVALGKVSRIQPFIHKFLLSR